MVTSMWWKIKKLSGSQLQDEVNPLSWTKGSNLGGFTGTTSNGSFIVKSGLSKGQRVIVDPDKGLKDGKTVETND